jgi:hypothetical protein
MAPTTSSTASTANDLDQLANVAPVLVSLTATISPLRTRGNVEVHLGGLDSSAGHRADPDFHIRKTETTG